MIDFYKRIKGNIPAKDIGIEIEAEFATETGEYSDNLKSYINKRIVRKNKTIHMNICENADGRLLLKFYGGPTGFESYYLIEILQDMKPFEKNIQKTFCICGGTINRWSKCSVDKKNVISFIEEVMGEDIERVKSWAGKYTREMLRF